MYSKSITCPQCSNVNVSKQTIVIGGKHENLIPSTCSKCGLVFAKYYGASAADKNKKSFFAKKEIKNLETPVPDQIGEVPYDPPSSIYDVAVSTIRVMAWVSLFSGIITAVITWIFSGSFEHQVFIILGGFLAIIIGITAWGVLHWAILITEVLIEIYNNSDEALSTLKKKKRL
jgi:cytochrome c biogenesis protein CcdA